MFSLSDSIVIGAPAETVWQVVAHRFDRIGEWATAIPSSAACAIAEPEVGAPVAGRVCHTDLRLVPEVTEAIVEYDEAGRTLTYQAANGLPGFVTRARNRWQVTPIDQNRTQVTFAAEVRVRGLFGWLARWVLLVQVGRTGRHLLDDLKHYVEHGKPSPRKQSYLDRHAVRCSRVV